METVQCGGTWGQPGRAGNVPITPRPPAAQVDDRAAAAIPDELKRADRWIVWRWTWKPDKDQGRGGWDKPPIDASGHPINAHDPGVWMSFEAARAAARRHGDGIGWVPGREEGLVQVDLDDVLDE